MEVHGPGRNRAQPVALRICLTSEKYQKSHAAKSLPQLQGLDDPIPRISISTKLLRPCPDIGLNPASETKTGGRSASPVRSHGLQISDWVETKSTNIF